MKIGIDISQIAHEGTGVANYLESFVKNLLKAGDKNEYVFLFSSFRKKIKNSKFTCSQRGKAQNYNSKFKIKNFFFPPFLLDLIWNRLHIFPIEWLIGSVDVFITSDWTEPPTTKAKKATILYDLIVYKYPNETDKKIIEVQKRKLKWVKKESRMIFCISQATKRDAMEVLGIEEERLKVALPGI